MSNVILTTIFLLSYCLVSLGVTVVSASEKAAAKERRIALIITNEKYTHGIDELPNTKKDFQIMYGALKDAQFDSVDIIKAQNVDRAQFFQSIRQYINKLKNAKSKGEKTIGLIYFSGHGIAVKGRNYLLPVGVSISNDDDVIEHGISLSSNILSKLEGLNTKSLVLIDACRNTFKSKTLANKGLVVPPVINETLVAFATQPGNVAVDGAFFSEAFANAISIPNLPAVLAFREVRRYVLDKTEGKQNPQVWDSFISNFYFKTDKSHPNKKYDDVSPEEEQRFAKLGAKSIEQNRCMAGLNCPRMIRISGDTQVVTMENGKSIKIQLKQARYIGRTEVTHKQWADCVKAGRCVRKDGLDDEPVTNVQWKEARGYVEWLREATGNRYDYRLLSEAEWEYLRMLASKSEKPSKNSTRAQFYRCMRSENRTDRGYCDRGYVRRAPSVEEGDQTVFGIVGLRDGVQEWIEDCYVSDRSKLPADGRARITVDAKCNYRIARGGSWNMSDSKRKMWQRQRYYPNQARPNVGFRVALTEKGQ